MKTTAQTTLWQIGQLELLGDVNINLMGKGSRESDRYLVCSLGGCDIREGGILRHICVWGSDVPTLIDELFTLATAEGTVIETRRPLRTNQFTFDHEFGSWVDAKV